MADFTNVEVTDTFDQWRVKTNQLGSDFIAFEAQVEEDIANIDLSDFVTISTAQTISGNKTFSGNSIFTGGVDLNGSIVTSYIAEGITTYAIELGLDKTGDMQSFIDFHATGGSDDYDARVFRSSSGVFEITQRGSGPLYLNTTDGANIELYSNTAEEAGARNNIYYDAELHIFRNKDGSDNKSVLIEDGTITADSTISAANVNITGSALSNKLTVQSGRMKLRNQDYTWPSSYSAGRYLRTDSQGNLTWEEVAGGSGSVNLSTLVFNDIVPVGTIMPWAGTSLPSDGKWKFCDGAQVSNATYPQLASLLGTKYGSASSGKTKLPNLGGKVPLGAGGTFSVGNIGGSGSNNVSISGTTGGTALTIDQMPKHDHVPNRNTYDTYNGLVRKSSQGYNSGNGFDNSVGEIDQRSSIKIEEEGGNQPHSHSFSGSTSISNYQPYVTTQYIIKVLPDDVQQVSITAGNGINVKNASNQDTATLDLFSTSINVKVNTNHFKFNNSGLLELKTVALDNIQNIPPGYVLGKGHGQTTGSPQKIYIDDDLSAVNASHDTVVSAKAVKNYVDTKVADSNIALEAIGQLGYSMSRISPSGSYIAVLRYYTSDKLGALSSGSMDSQGWIHGNGYTVTSGSGRGSTTSYKFNAQNFSDNKETFARVHNSHPTKSMKIDIDWQFISDTDDGNVFHLQYRFKSTANPLDTTVGGSLVTLVSESHGARTGGTDGQANTWPVRSTLSRTLDVPPQHMVFFKFRGVITGGSGQREGIGIRGFNIRNPRWS